jgi:Na+-driven multidrug efflux pump
MQLYSVGVVCHIGMKASAATLIPSEKAKNGEEAARQMADKLFVWGSIVGIILGIAQMAVTPILTPMFTTIPEVREAIKVPALITAFIQFANGPLFVGEGVMVGMGKFKALASCTIIGASVMIASILSPLGKTLNGVLLSLAAFNFIQSIAMVWHHLKIGPFSKMGAKDKLKKMQGV